VAPTCGSRVVNGGFETGSFTPGWTTFPASSGSDFGVSSTAHTGTHSVDFGATNNIDDVIQQTIPTIPGASYTFSFFLLSPDGSTDDHIAVKWNGVAVYDQTNIPNSPSWQSFSFSVVATSTSTIVELRGYNGPSFSYVDDVSVVPVSSVPDGITLAPQSPRTGVLTGSYTYSIVPAQNAVGAVTYSISSGSLPSGLTLSGSTISGSPTSTGLFTFTIQATDSNGCSASQSASINVIKSVQSNIFSAEKVVKNKGLSGGAIAGIVIGVTVGAAALIAGAVFAVKTLFF